jgi:hypothetical protein
MAQIPRKYSFGAGKFSQKFQLHQCDLAGDINLYLFYHEVL